MEYFTAFSFLNKQMYRFNIPYMDPMGYVYMFELIDFNINKESFWRPVFVLVAFDNLRGYNTPWLGQS